MNNHKAMQNKLDITEQTDFIFRVYLQLNMVKKSFRMLSSCVCQTRQGKEDVFLLWESIFFNIRIHLKKNTPVKF